MDSDYLKSERILLVDDEKELVDMVASILRTEGFDNIRTAQTVGEALAAAKSFQPELAVLDGMLPDGNGFSLMAHIRRIREKIELNPSRPVSLITGLWQENDGTGGKM